MIIVVIIYCHGFLNESHTIYGPYVPVHGRKKKHTPVKYDSMRGIYIARDPNVNKNEKKNNNTNYNKNRYIDIWEKNLKSNVN